MARRDELAERLIDHDVEALTLRHLIDQGMGDNTQRALASDVAYLRRDCALATTVKSLPPPAPEVLLLKFVAHHLRDPEKRAVYPEHGTPRMSTTTCVAKAF